MFKLEMMLIKRGHRVLICSCMGGHGNEELELHTQLLKTIASSCSLTHNYIYMYVKVNREAADNGVSHYAV